MFAAQSTPFDRPDAAERPATLTDADCENAVIARILRQGFQYAVEHGVTREHFTSVSAQSVFDVAAELYEIGEPVTAESVVAHIHKCKSPRRAISVKRGIDTSFYDDTGADPARLGELALLREANTRLKHAAVAVEDGNIDRARSALDAAVRAVATVESGAHELVSAKRDDEFGWRSADDIFAPLPETKWLVPGLRLCPGRPGLFAGYGSSAKTTSSQALAISIAAGVPAWGHFDVQRGRVRHLDYEQGFKATARRYQRLTLGHGIDWRECRDRLELSVFPKVYLDSTGAIDAYARICEGVDRVILDALRGATPTQDENDSAIRSCIDNLSRVSEKTGTAFFVLHHAGKPKDGHSDARTVLRGSSAIFDACGCVLVVTAGKKDEPRKVQQVKAPAEAEGGAIDDFSLAVEDVAADGNPTAGVRVLYQPITAASPLQQAHDRYEDDAQRLLQVIRENAGATQNVIISKAGIARTRANQTLAALEDEGRVHVSPGQRGAKTYRVALR